jgi:1-deoxy-D-xylulose-5-phosphate synthase
MKPSQTYPLLDNITLPADVRKLAKDQLKALAKELREFLTQSVSVSGGHFSAGLGTVELTVALHYVFDTPTDQLVWDVGHQAYPHKILTGRKDTLTSIRTRNGVCAFPNRAESEYDAFGVGHSSTSISAALGMAIASELKGENKHMVAIIGDGSITGGMAFEAMNHAGSIDANVLVIWAR